MMIEQTLIIIKPDGMARGLATTILSRFEKVGLKLEGIKILKATIEQAKQHYLYEDIATRHNETVWKLLIEYITEAPILVAVFSGDFSIEIARKIVGPTEPRQAPPGTIRGDYCHHSYALGDKAGKAVRNIIHASADSNDAKREIGVWFSSDELFNYRRVDDFEHYLGIFNDHQ
jgi:nucleoside-diphosphate kinase